MNTYIHKETKMENDLIRQIVKEETSKLVGIKVKDTIIKNDKGCKAIDDKILEIIKEYINTPEFKVYALKSFKQYLDNDFDLIGDIDLDFVNKFAEKIIKEKLGV